MNLLKYKIELAVNDAIRSANQFMAALRVGLTIDFGRRMIDGFLGIKRGLEGAMKEGLRFNATVESSVIGIAAVLRQFSSDKFATFGEAMRGAAEAVEYLKKRAKETPATFESLVMSFQSLSGPMSAAGIEMKKQIDLVVNMSQALSGLGIREDQLIQESRALVTGMINQNAAAAKILGITKEQIDAARESGQLYEFLTGKLSAFSEAAEVGATSFATAASNLKDSMQQAFGEATQGLFEQTKQAIKTLGETLEGGEVKTGLAMLAGLVGSLLGKLASLAGLVARHSVLFAGLATVFGAVAASAAAIKLTQLVVGMAAMTLGVGQNIAAHLRRIATLGAETVQVNAHTAATNANTAALRANNAAALKPVTSLNRPNFGGGNAAVLTGRSTAQAAGQMTTVTHTAESASAAAKAGAAQAGSSMASTFGLALSRLAIWGTIAYIIGSALAKMLTEWSNAKTGQKLTEIDDFSKQNRDFGDRIKNVSSVDDRNKLEQEVGDKLGASSQKLWALERKTVQTPGDHREMDSLRSEIAIYESFLKTLGNLTAEQIAANTKRIEAKKEAEAAAKVAAQKEQNRTDNEESFVKVNKSMENADRDAAYQERLAAADTPEKKAAIIKEEQKKVDDELKQKGDLGAAKSELPKEKFDELANEIEALNSKSLQLRAALASVNREMEQAEANKQQEIASAREANNARVAEHRYDNMTDEQKSDSINQSIAAVVATLRQTFDPLKREGLRERLMDLQEQQKGLAEKAAEKKQSLAAQAAEAKEGLGKMGLAATAGGDMGISQRFDYMAAVGQGRSPDEQIAANTEMMKNYLKAIAEAEGVK